ncbi:hypothetical protein J3A64_002744 [Pseudarthrobacter sp. PvP004]|nr:hypothetical protein [Pseudarthrobacter sp. PvP004]
MLTAIRGGTAMRRTVGVSLMSSALLAVPEVAVSSG